ncbi:MAG: hypothetical protein A3A86_03265 [Elusimicrobia bacterium RIFCSPLOWO2_01_FULL_60_11]|nr:MAG: hypothetical protein A3A86_03265 [Elusimicrobia bacterium RIFCSPLOWO2_01_FULL_60_11]
MDKNTVWFIAASAAFLLIWYKFFPPQAPAPKPPPAVVEKQSMEEKPDLKWLKRSGKVIPVSQTEKTLETPFAKVTMDSQGAGVRHWWVKNGRSPVDLVNPGPKELPFGTFPEINFELVKGGKPNEAEWKAILPSGVELRKRVVLDPQAPFADIILSLRNLTEGPAEIEDFGIGWHGGLGTVESERSENDKLTRVLAYPSPSKEVRVFKTGTHQQAHLWTGIDNRYYLLALFPDSKDFNVIAVTKDKKNPGDFKLLSPSFRLAPRETRNISLKVYAGAKGYQALKGWNMSLEQAVDFGYFGFLGKAAMKAMNGVHKVTHNYGWAIIVLTFCLQLILFPFTLTSYKSMAIMKRLQPKMKEIQDRFKGDPKRLSSEMMSLYKQAGTTPFSGCLPMLIQMPVFIAFFTMLRNSYELNGAPFAFWIHDLSKHDPYYVLPILTGGVMYLQQYLSGSTATDPTQKQMMLMMPAVFTVVFLRSPSGLALYWLTNSLVSMNVQLWATRKYAPASPAGGQAPLKT